MLSLKDLITKQTREDFEDSILGVAAGLGLSTTNWRASGKTRVMIASFSQLLSQLSDIVVDLASSGFLDLATGGWLTLLAKYVYNVDRVLATAATGPVTLHNSTGAGMTFHPGELRLEHATSGKTYTLQADVTVGAGGNASPVFAADEVGSASSATPGTITGFVTPIIGLTATGNAASLVGTDDELDPPLVDRCRLKLGALSPNGPAAAYEYVARSTPGVVVNRVLISKSSLTGTVTITVAAPGGALAGGDVTTLQAAIDSQVTPDTVTATVQSAVAHPFAVTTDVWIKTSANLTDGDVQSLVEAALLDFFVNAPIGGWVIPPAALGSVYQDAIKARVASASPFIFHATVATPAADTALGATDVPTAGAFTVNVHQVA